VEITVNPKKYARLANRVESQAIETEDEYDRMVAAVERLIRKGESNLSDFVGQDRDHGPRLQHPNATRFCQTVGLTRYIPLVLCV
jgi:hypothetical protein